MPTTTIPTRDEFLSARAHWATLHAASLEKYGPDDDLVKFYAGKVAAIDKGVKALGITL